LNVTYKVFAKILYDHLLCHASELVNCRRHASSLLYEQMLDIPDQRLLSRRSVWNFDPHPSSTLFSIPDAWTAARSASLAVNGDLIVNPNVRPPGFDLRRHNWLLSNRVGKRGFVESSACDCGAEVLLFANGLTGLCAMSDETVEYLSGLDLNL
jgi:hypothetical protein